VNRTQNSSSNKEDEDDIGWCLMATDTTASSSPTTTPLSSSCSSFMHVTRRWLRRVHAWWMVTCYSWSLKTASVVFAVCSCLILWSEMLMSSSLRSPIGYIMGIYSPVTDTTIVQGIAFLVLCYMSVCTYWTLFRMNIGWSYRLMAPQLSPPSSLIFNGEYLSRLQFSIAFNFLLILNDSKRYLLFFVCLSVCLSV
jgi:hypothetical protein